MFDGIELGEFVCVCFVAWLLLGLPCVRLWGVRGVGRPVVGCAVEGKAGGEVMLLFRGYGGGGGSVAVVVIV